MKRAANLTQLALLSTCLLACSPFDWRTALDSGARAGKAYRLGREHHLAQRLDAARAAYTSALQADPAHAGARNGLATLHAEERELAQAITIWRQLTASITLDSGPGKAYLYENLGNALLANGDVEEARIALEKACLLDPLNPRAWQLLGDTLMSLGQERRAQQMHGQAAALRQHDLRADFAAAGGKTGVAVLDQAFAKPTLQGQAQADWAQAWAHVGEDGLMELRRTPAAQPAAPVAVGMARLEIRNGNGVTGMARALSRRIDEPGVHVTRLSNEPGFAVRQTRIEYEAAYFDAAQKLAQRLGSAQLKQVDECGSADLRLVLGRDLARYGAALRLDRTRLEQLAYR